jgi:HD-GYP domain-containing protein (c-di-GMP phosphodiesterase class II)
VADAYDMMLRGRLYRPKRSPAEALEELAHEGGQFDVRVVEALRRVLEDPKASSTDSPRVL